MKILIHSNDFDIINRILQSAKDENRDIEMINGKLETTLYEHINNNDVDGYIIQDNVNINKQVSSIRKSNMYIPIMIIDTKETCMSNCDFSDEAIMTNANFYFLYDHNNLGNITIMFNMFLLYKKNFDILLKLTEKTKDLISIKFDSKLGHIQYDPKQRILLFNNKEIKKLSAKEGGVLEVLLKNYGKIINKDIILEKVWHKSDYFTSRSMDVYITHLRKLLKDAKLNMTIKNISGKGLIIE
jgi:hypothetical protein